MDLKIKNYNAIFHTHSATNDFTRKWLKKFITSHYFIEKKIHKNKIFDIFLQNLSKIRENRTLKRKPGWAPDISVYQIMLSIFPFFLSFFYFHLIDELFIWVLIFFHPIKICYFLLYKTFLSIGKKMNWRLYVEIHHKPCFS